MSQPQPDPTGRGRGGPVGAHHVGGGNLEGGADLFFDCVGSTTSLQEGLLALRSRGTYVLVGTAASLGPVDFSSLWFRELTLTGSAMYAYGVFRGGKSAPTKKPWNCWPGGIIPPGGWSPISSAWMITVRPCRRPLISVTSRASRWSWTCGDGDRRRGRPPKPARL